MISFYINLKFTHYNNTTSYVSLLTYLIVYILCPVRDHTTT